MNPLDKFTRTDLETKKRKENFLEVIFRHLEKEFSDSMLDMEFDEEINIYFLQKLNKLDAEDKKRVFCIPASLREVFFKKVLERNDNNQKKAVDEIIDFLVKTGKKYGFTLGYHTSTSEIKRPRTGDWRVVGYEFDDRDEMKMAYYSLDFDNLYLKKSPKYLYFIRAEIGENSPHKLDQKNNWARAQNLSIIAVCDIGQVFEKIKTE